MFENKFHPESLENTSFLVTGGAGFIGSNLVEYLLKFGAKEVRVLDNLSTGFKENLEQFSNHPNFSFINGDLEDYSICLIATEGIDYVLNQGALGSVPRSINTPIDTHNSNVTGFINILNAAKENKVKRFVYASSSSVYGDSPDLPKVESKTGNLLSPYAATKHMNEVYASVFERTYGIETIGLRYFNVFGQRQSPKGAYAAVIPLFAKAILNDESPILNGDGLQTRDFTYIENVVQANIKAAFTKVENATGKAYNVATGHNFTLKQLVEYINRATNKNIEPKHREDRAGDIRNSLADISQISKYLEYNPTVQFEEGIAQTIKWFIQNPHILES